MSASVITKAASPLQDYFRCLDLPPFGLSGSLGKNSGFFQFGPGVICFGQTTGETRPIVNGWLFDAAKEVRTSGNGTLLPFDMKQVVNNLRYEAYANSGQRMLEKQWIKDFYYRMRPFMPVPIRKHLQTAYLKGWEQIKFPNWPVDRSVDLLHERLLVLAMKDAQVDRVPFIWFWPKEYSACAVMTHDVETTLGRDFSKQVMDIDDQFGIKASFQIVPEKRYIVPESYLESIRQRGFEVNVQGLDHDGDLFQDRATFLQSAKKINQYAAQYQAVGFRSPILYRKTDWFRDLQFSYDMSVPNVARLEAQRGGCCTIMPYTLPGGMTEIPVTVTEDYTLFHVLKDYSTSLWKKQMNMILEGHGVMNIIIHPDYVTGGRAQDLFKELMQDLADIRSKRGVWIPLPKDVDSWWRQRNDMQLIPDGRSWKITGPGSERAAVAFAHMEEGNLKYELPSKN